MAVEKKTASVNLRVRPTDKERWLRCAEEDQRSLADWVYQQVEKAEKQREAADWEMSNRRAEA